MTPPRQRLLSGLDRVIAGLLVALVLGSALAFGASAWWGPAAIVLASSLLGLASLAKATVEGRWELLKSPLAAIGLLAMAIGVAQLLPLPAGLAIALSSKAHEAHASGRAPIANGVVEAPSGLRTPATLDRPATLRWVVGAGSALVLFCVSAHFVDRLSRSMLVWGSVAAAFAICSALGVVQLLADSGGLYGAIEPGSGPISGPSLADLAESPGSTSVLRLSADPRRPRQAWPVSRPDRQFQFGSLIGGSAAYLALAALGLPLALGMTLQALAPRGSREGLRTRLRESNRGGLAFLLAMSTVLGAGLVGYLSGPFLCVPFAIGLALTGFPTARGTGLRWAAISLTCLAIAGLATGLVVADQLGRPAGIARPEGAGELRQVWASAWRMARDFPVMGSGLGTFGVVSPYYKTVDQTRNFAGSGLAQWWVEAGWAGISIPLLATIWCLIRLPGAIHRVGSADRALAFGLIGAFSTFGILWIVHGPGGPWSVTLAACALAGTGNRWLAGGTDLFVEAS